MQESAGTTAAPAAAGRPRVRLLERPVLLLGAAAGVRVLLFVLLLATGVYPHDGWYFPNDDQNRYYGFAKGLVEGHLVPQVATIGYDVFLIPFAAGTDFVLQAIPPVAIVQLALSLPAALLLRVAGERLVGPRAGLLAAAVWLALPFVGLLYLPTGHGPVAVWLGFEIVVEYAGGLTVIALLAAAAGSRTDASLRRGFVIGALGGLALLIKPPWALALAAAVAAQLVWRRYAQAAVACAVAAVVLVPQLVYNNRLFGDFTMFASSASVGRRYLPMFPNVAGGTYSIGNLPRAYGRLIVHNASGPLILLALAAALVLAWRRHPATRWLVVAQVVAAGVFFGVFRYGTGDSLLRYLTPTLPAVALAVGAAFAPPLPARRLAEARPPRVIGPLALALVLAGSAALSAWIAVAPRAPNAIVAGSARASVAGGRVELRWKPPSAPATLTYQVLRSQRRGPGRSAFVLGWQWLDYPDGKTIGVRGATSLVDRPGPGVWWYRVLVAPGPVPHGWPPGVALASSPPVRVVVP